MVSIVSPIRGIADFEEYLFDGMRLDEDEFDSLDETRISRIAPLYHKTNPDRLIRVIERRKNR
jgi:hypothetical protein